MDKQVAIEEILTQLMGFGLNLIFLYVAFFKAPELMKVQNIGVIILKIYDSIKIESLISNLEDVLSLLYIIVIPVISIIVCLVLWFKKLLYQAVIWNIATFLLVVISLVLLNKAIIVGWIIWNCLWIFWLFKYRKSLWKTAHFPNDSFMVRFYEYYYTLMNDQKALHRLRNIYKNSED